MSPQNDTRCRDCATETLPTAWGLFAEYYMVHDDLWHQAGMDGTDAGFLCIGCLEARLRRTLQPDDFIDARVNDPDHEPTPEEAWSYRTQRLQDRLIGGTASSRQAA